MERLFPSLDPSPSRHGRAARSVALLLALLFGVTGVVAAGDLHPTGDGCHDGHRAPVAEATCALGAHPDAPLHAEAAPTAEARLCPACLLRAQSVGVDLPAPARLGLPTPSTARAIPRSIELPASPVAGSTAPRGPPISPLS